MKKLVVRKSITLEVLRVVLSDQGVHFIVQCWQTIATYQLEKTSNNQGEKAITLKMSKYLLIYFLGVSFIREDVTSA